MKTKKHLDFTALRQTFSKHLLAVNDHRAEGRCTHTPSRSLNLLMKVDNIFIIQRCLGQPKLFGWRLAILAGQDVIVDRVHVVENFGNVT